MSFVWSSCPFEHFVFFLSFCFSVNMINNEIYTIRLEMWAKTITLQTHWPLTWLPLSFESSYSSPRAMALCSIFCPRIPVRFRPKPISPFLSKPLFPLSYRVYSSLQPTPSTKGNFFSFFWFMPSHGAQLPQVLLFLRTMSCVTNAKKDVWITISNFPLLVSLVSEEWLFYIWQMNLEV